MTTDAPLRNSWAVESLLFAKQLLTHWRREPTVPIQAMLFPTFLLVVYQLLVGKSMVRITGTDSIYSLVPMCAVAGAMFGALAACLTLPIERDSGLLSRLWVLPVHRASALTGRLIAEVARNLAGTALITAVGIWLGLRFEGSWFTVIPFLLVPVVVGVVFSMAVVAIAVRAQSPTALIWLSMPSITLVFASSGVPPLETYPAWMRPIIHLQPLAPTIESMRALAQGDPALWPLLLCLIWVLGLGAIVGPLAVRGYRVAAESGR